MAVVERIAHRIAVMYAGQIVEIGDAASVLSNPRHSYNQAADRVRCRRSSGAGSYFELDTSEIPSLVRPPGFEPAPHNGSRQAAITAPGWRRHHDANCMPCSIGRSNHSRSR